MIETSNPSPNRSLKVARTITWAVATCLALAVLVWIAAMVQDPQQSRSHYRPKLPSVENTESHPQPAWLLDRG